MFHADSPIGIDPNELLLLRRELELKRRLTNLEKNNGLLAYKPHRKQQIFHAKANKRYRYARTGNRFGKSEMGAAEDCAFALGERIWIPKGNPLRTLGIPKYPTKGLIICADWEKVEEIFTNGDDVSKGKLFGFLPTDSILGIEKNHSGYISKIKVKRLDGQGISTITFDTVKSFKANPLGSESGNYDWIHVDEPCPNDMFVAHARGLTDRGGKVWFTCTPLTEVWINDLFVPSRRTKIDDSHPFLEHDDMFMLTGSIHDNPYLNKEDIDAFYALLTPDQIQCRIYGKPFALAGLVYKEFDYEFHVLTEVPYGWVDFDIPPKDYTIRYAIDPHPQKAHAVLFIATSPTGHHFLYDEIHDQCLVSELCMGIKARIRNREPVDEIIDPIANTRDPITGTTMMTEFEDHGLSLTEATKDVPGGILKVREFLRSRRDGKALFHVSPNLTRTLYEFDHYLWDGAKGKPIKENDDMMENLYRLGLTGLSYIEPDLADTSPNTSSEAVDLDYLATAVVDDALSFSLDDFYTFGNPEPPMFRGRLGRKRYNEEDVY